MEARGRTVEHPLRRMLAVVRPHTLKLVIATVTGLVGVACGLGIPLVTKRVIDSAIVQHRKDLLLPLALLVIGLGLVRAFANFLRRNLAGIVSVHVEADLRASLFAHLQGLPVSFHEEWQSGQLLARTTSDLNVIRMFLGFALVFFGFLVATFVGVAILLFFLSWTLALMTLAVAAPILFVALRFNARMESVSLASREAVGDVTNVVEESAGGIRILKAFGREERAIERLDTAAARLRDVNLEAVGYRARYIPALSLLPNGILAIVLGIGGMQVIHGSLSLGGLVAFNQYLALLVWPLRNVGWILSMSQQAIAASERVFEILDSDPAIADEKGARPLGPVAGEVRFEKVTFSYPGADAAVLQELDLTVAAGETVALVGATGSGKSTVVSLVPRFDDPTSGRVLVDGQDIRRVTIRSLRRQIGMVFDEPVLFSASIRDNIAFGEPDASDEEVVRAARTAGAHDFITTLPLGYQTRVGEQGMSLSGGQRQRIALARALLPQPRILILDDPLSSVDVKTEAQIEENLRSCLQGRTCFLIAHRASTVAMADRILLLDRGRIVATGTHESLLATNDDYRAILAADLDLDDLHV